MKSFKPEEILPSNLTLEALDRIQKSLDQIVDATQLFAPVALDNRKALLQSTSHIRQDARAGLTVERC